MSLLRVGGLAPGTLSFGTLSFGTGRLGVRRLGMGLLRIGALRMRLTGGSLRALRLRARSLPLARSRAAARSEAGSTFMRPWHRRPHLGITLPFGIERTIVV